MVFGVIIRSTEWIRTKCGLVNIRIKIAEGEFSVIEGFEENSISAYLM